MKKLILEIHDDVLKALEKLEDAQDNAIDLEIPEGSVLFDNIVSLKFLLKEASALGKTLNFHTTDLNGLALIESILSGNRPQEDFTSREFTPSVPKQNKISGKSFFSKIFGILPGIPALNFSLGGGGMGKKLLIVGLIFGFIFGGYKLLASVPQAFIKISVDSQPLIKSIAVKVMLDKPTSATQRVLSGRKVEAVTSDTAEMEPTGTKIVGESASGKVKLYNYTDQEVKLSKGTEIYFNEDDYDLTYTTKSSVTVPAETFKEPGVPGSPTVPGEVSVEVTASDIGEDYNIDKGSTLTLDDYKKTEVVGAAEQDFTGGESSEVKVVAEADLLKLEEDLKTKLTESSETLLKAKQGIKYKLIEGSTATTVITKKYSAEVNDEAATLSLDMEVKAYGLAYSTDDLHRLLDDLVESFIPEGYKLSAKDRSTNVEILGNSDDTVLSDKEADLQVTLKSFVVPNIDENKLKADLKGKKVSEAQELLNNIQNVNSFELNISPNIPFFGRVPSSEDSLVVEIILN